MKQDGTVGRALIEVLLVPDLAVSVTVTVLCPMLSTSLNLGKQEIVPV